MTDTAQSALVRAIEEREERIENYLRIRQGAETQMDRATRELEKAETEKNELEAALRTLRP